MVHADPRFEYADRLRKIENELEQRIGTDEERARRAAERAEFKRTDFGPGVFRDESLMFRNSSPVPDIYEIEKRVRAKIERLAMPERDRPPSEKMRDAGYTFERAQDGRAEYSLKGDLPIIDRVDGVFVIEPEHYTAAVELARERYGDTIKLSSVDPGLMRAVQEAGMSVKNFANEEQREIYEGVAGDLRRERGLERELPVEPAMPPPSHADVERAEDARAERDEPEHLASIVAR